MLLLPTSSVEAINVPFTVKNGRITYRTDSKGNRLLDYSSCGFKNSESSIPDVPVKVFVECLDGDNSSHIQEAIDYVSSLPVGKDGVRGAVLLGPGNFRIESPLRISSSGVVVRGSGRDETVIKKYGYDRGSAIYVEGIYNLTLSDTISIVSDYVPVNTKEMKLSSPLSKGDHIFILRPSTKQWIESLGCDVFGGGIGALGWKPGDIDLRWDRTVANATGSDITLDYPVTMPLDKGMAESVVFKYTWPGRISDIGIENLTIVSEYNKKYPKDEDHCWNGISIANAGNCWVRKVDFKNLAGSAVILLPTASKTTVEDCVASEPVSEIGGMRRQVFLSLGQQNLFQRCVSKNGINDFSAGMYAPGPNAFVQCDAIESLGFSGASDSWAPGLLFDIVNIDGNDISFKNLRQDKNGAGWNTANSTAWQCTASGIDCFDPGEGLTNNAYGCWSQFSGDGGWGQSNNHVQPRSLFYYQLSERMGDYDSSAQAYILPMETNATSSPTVEQAMKLAKEVYTPRLTMENWILQVPFTASTSSDGIITVDQIKSQKGKRLKVDKNVNFEIINGHLTADGAVLTGGHHEVPWWNGKIKPNYTVKAKPHITRHVPGREGLGLTDRIDSVVALMDKQDILVLDHNYSLWYERRRDDHERIRRRDGDVWAPFYDQPFGRTGDDTGWDGLSKYDLTKPNEWYWSRLNEFASKGADHGKLLFNEHYMQHNIIEAGAHWVDSPWRTANNVNDTPFPEPVPFAGDKRIFMADIFYDVDGNPGLAELHRNYIRANLDRLSDHSNVVHLVSAEYTGPLHFVEFWLRTIADWQKETGKDVNVAISVTKDVQDAVLENPEFKDLIDIIDIRYWHYNTNGLYAPEGGKNLAPRQHARKMKVGNVTFEEAYKAVSEYRSKYPDKAVTYYAQNYPAMAWAVFMADGSGAGIPRLDNQLLKDATSMKIVESGNQCKMLSGEKGTIVYVPSSESKETVNVNIPYGKYQIYRIDMQTGDKNYVSKKSIIKDTYPLPDSGIYWFKKLAKIKKYLRE